MRVYPEGSDACGGAEAARLHLALGMFDGVHLGHQSVIGQAREWAARRPGDLAGVLSFDPHPSRVLHPDRATSLLMPLDLRVERMLAFGVDRVFIQPFTRAYSRWEAADFVPALKDRFPTLESLHIGNNFRFGAGRKGDIEVLFKTAAPMGIEVLAQGPKTFEGEPISSSRIREALADGRMQAVQAMLGSPYTVTGTAQGGRKIGRGLGYPTLNFKWDPEAGPRYGVYRVVLEPEGCPLRLDGIANYGVRPTLGAGQEPLLEVHLLEPAVAPHPIHAARIALLDFIRPEQTFPSLEALREQIGRDTAMVRQFVEDGSSPNLSTW